MADTKRGRDKKAHDREKRQRRKEILEERRRLHETEPPANAAEVTFGDLTDELTEHDYPTTSHDLVDRFGTYEVSTGDGWISIAAIFDDHHTMRFESPEAVQQRIVELVANA